MIRLLILTIFISLLYFAFSFVSSYDTSVRLQFLDYSISISSFFLIALTITGSILLAFISKILALILNAPSIISSKIKTSKLQHNLNQIMEGYALCTSDNKAEASRLINRIKNELPTEFAVHAHIILSMSDPNPEQRTHHLRYLLDNSEYRGFAAKELARYFTEHKYYQQALDYAEQALELREYDAELLQISLMVYAEMFMWDRFEEIVTKLEKLNPQMLQKSAANIAHYYFAAAKDVLARGEDDKAVYYLEQALTYQVNLSEAASLLCSLLVNTGNMHRSRGFLSNAFAASPSFELFELYVQSSSGSQEEIYDEVSLLADPKRNLGLFIAISTYLGLDSIARRLVQESIIETQG